MTLLVVRHAPAGRRSSYKGDDRLRPLSPRGHARAVSLAQLLDRFHPKRILSSPYVRCCETVEPLAELLAIPVESVDELAEGNGAASIRLLKRMAGESAVLCTHGDVALEMLEFLTPDPHAADRTALKLQKGEVWVVNSTGTTLAIVDHIRRARAGTHPS